MASEKLWIWIRVPVRLARAAFESLRTSSESRHNEARAEKDQDKSNALRDQGDENHQGARDIRDTIHREGGDGE